MKTKHKNDATLLPYLYLALDNDVYMRFYKVEVRFEHDREEGCCTLEVLTYHGDEITHPLHHDVASSLWLDTDRIKAIIVGTWKNNKLKEDWIWEKGGPGSVTIGGEEDNSDPCAGCISVGCCALCKRYRYEREDYYKKDDSDVDSDVEGALLHDFSRAEQEMDDVDPGSGTIGPEETPQPEERPRCKAIPTCPHCKKPFVFDNDGHPVSIMDYDPPDVEIVDPLCGRLYTREGWKKKRESVVGKPLPGKGD